MSRRPARSTSARRRLPVVALTVLALAVTTPEAMASQGVGRRRSAAGRGRRLGRQRASRAGAAVRRDAAGGHQLPDPGRALDDLRLHDRTLGGRARDRRAPAGQPAAATRVLLVNGQMHGEEWPGPRSVTIAARPAYAGDGVVPDLDHLARSTPTAAGSGGAATTTASTSTATSTTRGRRCGTPARGRVERAGDPRDDALPELDPARPRHVAARLLASRSTPPAAGGGPRGRATSRASPASVRPSAVPCEPGPCHGNMTDWYTRVSTSGGVAVTVEMPRSSARARACRVPGRASRATPIRCTAWAAKNIAARLPA